MSEDLKQSKWMKNKGFQGTYTICDLHRSVFHLIKEINEEGMPISEEQWKEFDYMMSRAFVNAKKMDAKLRQYAFNNHDEWYKEESSKHEEWMKELTEK